MAENDIFRFLSTIFENVNFFNFPVVYLLNNSIILKNIFGYLVSDHFFRKLSCPPFCFSKRKWLDICPYKTNIIKDILFSRVFVPILAINRNLNLIQP